MATKFATVPTASDEPLLTKAEAARRLGVKPETLKKMAQRGQISSIKYGKLRLFEPRVIRAFIDQHRIPQAG